MPHIKKDWATEEDSINQKLLPEGNYNFEVMTAELSTSAKGNEMITLRLKVYDGHGSHVSIFDRLVFVDAAGWKIAQFVKSIGQEDLVGAELTVAHCLGATGELYAKAEHDVQYGDRNVVGGYNEAATPAVALPSGKPVKATELPTGDDIPF